MVIDAAAPARGKSFVDAVRRPSSDRALPVLDVSNRARSASEESSHVLDLGKGAGNSNSRL